MLAYVDPGLGMLIWQTIVAVAVGLLFYLKKIRRAIFGFCLKIIGRKTKVTIGSSSVPAQKAAKVEREVKMR
jgi:hypothetical protein